jgi:hypothetical protein
VLAAVAAVLVLIAINAASGVGATRIENPAVSGHPRPVHTLFGFEHWITLWQIFAVVMPLSVITLCVVMWRRHPRHPYLLMAIATTAVVWQDPLGNWSPYAVYDPRLWHWPETWGYVSLSPTVEPFIVIGYVMFYFGPFFVALWLLRRLQARRARESYVWRHPLISLALLILGFGFIFDATLELTLIEGGVYIYSQVIPFGSVFTGTAHQFPLLWESLLVTLVMIPAGVLCYRDDTGKAQAEKLAQRFRAFDQHRSIGTFLVMFAFVNIGYFAYVGAFTAIRMSGKATSVACPWPYPETKVYDPQGYYEKAGQPGPYFPGIWDGWETAQSGRPSVTPPADGGRCGASRG